MLEGAGAEQLFEDDAESPDLRRYGVAPRHVQRRLLVDTLERVIAPVLTRYGVSAASLTAWLAAHRSR